MRCSVWENFPARGAKEKWGISRVPGGREGERAPMFHVVGREGVDGPLNLLWPPWGRGQSPGSR